MADEPRDNTYGYGLVMRAITAKIGPDASPQTWLANELGISRQIVHFWAKNGGIPAKHVPIVSRLTGLSKLEIRPEDVSTALPGSIFDEIVKQAEAKRITFTTRVVSLLRAGLKINP